MSNEQPLSRNHYFTGKLLTAEDFNDEQNYILERHRRHNRKLHGYGVVCGLQVKLSGSSGANGQEITVAPGFAIDGYGNEIVVPSIQDIRLLSDSGSPVIWVCLCYAETFTENVPVPGSPDEGETVKASRIIESFKLYLVTQPGAKCYCDSELYLARLQHTPAGWDVARDYHPPRLRRIKEKTLWAATALGAAAGMLLGLVLSRR